MSSGFSSTTAGSSDDKPESKSLKAWWSAFTKVKAVNQQKSSKSDGEDRVFGQPLRRSLKYASVAISMAGEDGQQYVWGYVPVIVAKIGLYLKENATEVEGVFRIAGSQKRMRELQETFDTAPRYGKNVDWTKYSVHDAASVLRRYLNQMPEPIVPLHLYNEFRAPMVKDPLDLEAATRTYRLLITSCPPANQYLLLYVLDLLAVFARKCETNLMTPSTGKYGKAAVAKADVCPHHSDLAVIFQPGMFSHPSHLQSANEHKLAVSVLEFLIEHQDHFVLGLSPPPPANVGPAELTAVSQPHPAAEEAAMVPSDSDEDDFANLEVHEGGGARLGRSATATAATPSPARKRGLFSSRRKEGAASPSSKLEENEEHEDIGGQSNAPVAAVAAVAAAQAARGVRRSKTTPSRKSAGGTSVEGSADADAPGDAASPPGSRRVSRQAPRRKSSDAGSPSPSAHASPRLSARSPTASPAPFAQSAAAAPKPQDAIQPLPAPAIVDDNGLPTPPPSKLLSPEAEETVDARTTSSS